MRYAYVAYDVGLTWAARELHVRESEREGSAIVRIVRVSRAYDYVVDNNFSFILILSFQLKTINRMKEKWDNFSSVYLNFKQNKNK